jgi:hypothetical protein
MSAWCRTERVAVAPHHGAQVVGAQCRRGGHGRDANLCAVREGLRGPSPRPPSGRFTHGSSVRYLWQEALVRHEREPLPPAHQAAVEPQHPAGAGLVDGAPKRLHVCTSCIRAGKVTKPPAGRTRPPDPPACPRAGLEAVLVSGRQSIVVVAEAPLPPQPAGSCPWSRPGGGLVDDHADADGLSRPVRRSDAVMPSAVDAPAVSTSS